MSAEETMEKSISTIENVKEETKEKSIATINNMTELACLYFGFRPYSISFDRINNRFILPCGHALRIFDRETPQQNEQSIKLHMGSFPRGTIGLSNPFSGLVCQPITNHILLCNDAGDCIRVISQEKGEEIKSIGNTSRGLFVDPIPNSILCEPTDIDCFENGDFVVSQLRRPFMQAFDASGSVTRCFSTQKGERPREAIYTSLSILSSLVAARDLANSMLTVWSKDGTQITHSVALGSISNYDGAMCMGLDGYLFVNATERVIKVYEPRMSFAYIDSIIISEVSSSHGSADCRIAGICVDNTNILMVVDSKNKCIGLIGDSCQNHRIRVTQ